jgi:hypothetical protein
MEAEGAALLAALPRDAHVIALDGRGTAWSSEQLSGQLSSWRMAGRDLAFLIGGPDGHARDVLQRADQRWSLGSLTLPLPSPPGRRWRAAPDEGSVACASAVGWRCAASVQRHAERVAEKSSRPIEAL